MTFKFVVYGNVVIIGFDFSSTMVDSRGRDNFRSIYELGLAFG